MKILPMTTTMPMMMARSARRAALLLTASALAGAAGAAPLVRCHVDYGGETRVVELDERAEALGTPTQPVGSYFLWRAVLQRDGRRIELRIDTDADRDAEQSPLPLHQGRFQLPERVSAAAADGGFTGWQRVHEPLRDGELQYACERTATPLPPPPRPAAAPRPARRADPDARVRLIFAGDLMLDDGPGRLIAAGGDPLAPFDALLRQADVRIGNLECPVAASGTPLPNKIYSFRAEPATLRVLQGRFDALSVANNHAGDQGPAAFVETLERVRAAGITPFGGGRDLREAHRPLWIERAGLRIALLAYDEFKPRSFRAGPSTPGVAWSDDAQVVADIRAARQAGADVVIPFMHWGWEREPEAGERQRRLARRMIEAGADAVVGGHPHVTQGADLVAGRPVVWSLGNFVFDGFEDFAPARRSWLLRMTVDAQGVRDWDTVQADIDLQGTPHPDLQAWTPCGRRGVGTVLRCQAGAQR